MGELGFPGAVVEAIEPSFQSAIWMSDAPGSTS